MAGPSLIATLGANISGFVKDLETAKGTARHEGEGIASALGEALEEKLAHLGTAVGIEEAFRRTFEWAEKLANLSARTGLGTTELQKLEGLAAKTGTSVESLAGFYERLGKAIAAAHEEGPGGKTTGAMERLGVSEASLGSGDMAGAMQEVATHFQTLGQITPQVEADLAKIFKNAREVIPALKGMTEEESMFNESVAVAPEKIAAMAIVMETIKDGWRVITGFGKTFIGTITEGWLKIGQLSKATLAGVGAALTGGSFKDAAYESMNESIDAQKKKQDELAGQKGGGAEFAKTDAAKKAANDAKEHAAEMREHDARELESLRQKTAEEERRAKLAGMTKAERTAELQAEVDELRIHDASGKWHSESDVEFARKHLELRKREAELAGDERQEDEKRNTEATKEAFRDKRTGYASAQTQFGGVIGTFSATSQIALLDVQTKSEQHLAAIKKDIARIVNNRSTGGVDDVEF
jgi:hypothetical protein